MPEEGMARLSVYSDASKPFYGLGIFPAVVALLILLDFSPILASPQSTPRSGHDQLSEQADAARDANRLDQAISLYEQALALRPKWAAGWWSLGTILYDQSDYGKAAQAFRRVVALTPSNGTAWVMLGLCEFELGRDGASLRHIEKGKRLGIANDSQLQNVVLYHEGVLQRREGRFEAAGETLRKLCAAGIQSAPVEQALGLTALRIGKKNSPEAGRAQPEVILRVGAAECLAARGEFGEAKQIYQSLASDHSDNPNLDDAYGSFLLELHETRDAEKEFKQAIKSDPGQVIARLQVAAIQYRVDSQAGLPYAEEAVRLDPRLPFGHYLLGLLFVDTKQYQEAIPQLEMARAAFSGVPNLYYALGTAYSRVGRKRDAENAWATFARLNRTTEKSGPLYYGQKALGGALQDLGRYKRYLCEPEKD
jgi:tetratricopeptide (TPR) repeat protein